MLRSDVIARTCLIPYGIGNNYKTLHVPSVFQMCYLQEPPMEIVVQDVMASKPKVKKLRKAKNQTGVEVVEAVLKTPEPQMIVSEQLPSYEEMQRACYELVNGPSSMETQPDLNLDEGFATLSEGDELNLEELTLQEYLMDASQPLHTTFVLPPNAGKKFSCPVYFGNADQKHLVMKILCNEIHPKIQKQWGSFACHDGLVPKLKLSQTAKNPNKVFLSCPKEREARCNYFQWIHEAPKPLRVCSPASLKKRMQEMAQENLTKRVKVAEVAGGFTFP